jgi:hypothetical protein
MGAKVRGIPGLRRAFKEFGRRKVKGLHRGIKKAAAYLLGESLEIVPVDTGYLRASAYINTYAEGSYIQVLVGYTAEYAIYVHEDLELRHGQEFNDWYIFEIQAGLEHERGPNQQAKFLSQPFRTEREYMLEIISEEVAAA